MDAALAKHVKPADVAAGRSDRARLQAALRSPQKTIRDAAVAEIRERAAARPEPRNVTRRP
jgi:hypothetical protein